MDPVDKTFYWLRYYGHQISSSASNVVHSDVVNQANNVLNRVTDSIFDLYKHKVVPLETVPEQNPNILDQTISAFYRNSKPLGWLAFWALLGTAGACLYYRKNISKFIKEVRMKRYIHEDKIRRAKKLSNGARNCVVVILGSSLEPLVRIIANDLDKRGFIVYISATNDKEIEQIYSENSVDIRPFILNSSKEETLAQQISNFNKIINSPVTPFPTAKPHHLKLVGVLAIPDLYYPSAPIESLSLKSWSDSLNAKILSPLTLLSNRFLDVIRKNNEIDFHDTELNNLTTKFVLMTPNLISSLNIPFNAPETVAINALSTIFQIMSREIYSDKSLKLNVFNLKVGRLDNYNESVESKLQERRKLALQNEILSWDKQSRTTYGQLYKQYISVNNPSYSIRSSNLRKLNHKIYDIFFCDVNRSSIKKSRDIQICYVGYGSRCYDFVSKYMPHWFTSLFFSNNFGCFLKELFH